MNAALLVIPVPQERAKMNEATRAQLQLMVEKGSPSYRDQARKLLSGEVTWLAEEIAALIDSYLNEPYLTRNK